jgi:hypothetical protein
VAAGDERVIRGPLVKPAVLAWALCAVTIAVLVAAVVLAIADPGSGGPDDANPAGPTVNDQPSGGYVAFTVLAAIVFSAFALVGAAVAARRPRNPVGWLFGVAGLSWALGVLTNGLYWHFAFGRPDYPAAADLLAWLGTWISSPALVSVALILLLFPTGSPPSRRWRIVGWLAAVAGGVWILSTALAPGGLDQADFGWVENPLGIEGLGLGALAKASSSIWPFTALAAVVSLVVRYGRSRGIERLQLRWVAAAGCLLVAIGVAGTVVDAVVGGFFAWVGALFGLLTIAAAVGVALLRYRLYEIDTIVNRTLVYGALTATLAAAYLGSVLLLQLALDGLTSDSNLAIAGSTLAVAALFRPARNRIQGLVDRRFYRRRYDAQRTLESFSSRLRDEVDLSALDLELRGVVAATMQPAHVSLWLRGPEATP